MSSQLDIPAILGCTQIFGELDKFAREAVAAKLRPVTFAAGDLVFARGDQGRELYIVLSGRVRLSVPWQWIETIVMALIGVFAVLIAEVVL